MSPRRRQRRAAPQGARLLYWQRRCREDKDEAGRFRLAQETNVYAVLPSSHWRGYHEPPEAPRPHPTSWGAAPLLPDPIAQAVDELRHGQQRTALAALMSDPNNALALALAELGRAVLGSQP